MPVPSHLRPLLRAAQFLTFLLLMVPATPALAQRTTVGVGVSVSGNSFFHDPPDCGAAFGAPFEPMQERPFGGTLTLTLYVTFLPTTALSTSTECIDDALTYHRLRQVHYVAHNRERVLRDAARGGGAHLEALTVLYGCGRAETATVGRTLRDRFGAVAARAEAPPLALRDAIAGVLRAEPALAAACPYLG